MESVGVPAHLAGCQPSSKLLCYHTTHPRTSQSKLRKIGIQGLDVTLDRIQGFLGDVVDIILGIGSRRDGNYPVE